MGPAGYAEVIPITISFNLILKFILGKGVIEKVRKKF